MDYLQNELKRQDRIFIRFEASWSDIELTKDRYKMISWFYELSLYMMYRFYTEEVYLKYVKDQDHIKAHHKLLNIMFQVLINHDVSEIVRGIDDFFDVYKTHKIHFDQRSDYYVPDASKSYFRPSDSHGGFIVIAFKRGYYSVAFGALTNEVASNYLLDPSDFDPGWTKFVDLRRWAYLTHDAVDVSVNVNELEVRHGLGKSYFIINEDGVSQFSVDQFTLDKQKPEYIYHLNDLVANRDLIDMLGSNILDYFIVSSRSYIDTYFENYLDNQLE